MATLATTKMSSKGQIVIPEEIRKRLKLKTGAQFVVVGDNDVVILKSISAPSREEFDALIAAARRQAKTAGLEPAHVEEAITRARGHK
jgi:AbrB family looped-hinge helix DNA binding protein